MKPTSTTFAVVMLAVVLVPAIFTQTAFGEYDTWTNKQGRYEGEQRNRSAHGHGIMIYADGDRYEGEWRDGKRHGHGTYVYADGHRYEGEWRDGKKHGHGTSVYADGYRYEGEWRDGKRHGHGTSVFADGHRYEGEWRDDKRHGHGTFVYADGRRYDGELRNNKQHGHGTFVYADGRRYEGEWRDGKEQGPQTFISQDDTRYQSEYRDNKLARSNCLDIEHIPGSVGYWVNRCDVGVDVLWYNEDNDSCGNRGCSGCESRKGSKFNCSWYVAANSKRTAILWGRTVWLACESESLGDALAIEDSNGNPYCSDRNQDKDWQQIQKDWKQTTASLQRGEEQEKARRQQELKKYLAALKERARAEQARERRQWEEQEREWEREEAELAKKLRQREGAMWNQIGKSLGEIIFKRNESNEASGSGPIGNCGDIVGSPRC